MTVSTKKELRLALKKHENKIIVCGALALKLQKIFKNPVKKILIVTATLAGIGGAVLIAAVAAAPVTGGTSALVAAPVIATTAASAGLPVMAIIEIVSIAVTVGVPLFITLVRGYSVQKIVMKNGEIAVEFTKHS